MERLQLLAPSIAFQEGISQRLLLHLLQSAYQLDTVDSEVSTGGQEI